MKILIRYLSESVNQRSANKKLLPTQEIGKI